MKTCTACKIQKSFDNFHKNKTKLDGYELKCKPCRNTRVMELYYHHKENPKPLIQEGFKKCNDCDLVKTINDFNKRKSTKGGYRHNCRICQNLADKIDSKNRRDKIRKTKQAYYKQNKDKIIRRSADYNIHKYKTDLMFRLRSNLRSRIKSILKKKRLNKNNSFIKYLGCTLPEFKAYLESQFAEGMTWDNYGHNGWVIDHIIPISRATNEDELYKLNHYSNLQPLWEKDNMIKSDN